MGDLTARCIPEPEHDWQKTKGIYGQTAWLCPRCLLWRTSGRGFEYHDTHYLYRKCPPCKPMTAEHRCHYPTEACR